MAQYNSLDLCADDYLLSYGPLLDSVPGETIFGSSAFWGAVTESGGLESPRDRMVASGLSIRYRSLLTSILRACIG